MTIEPLQNIIQLDIQEATAGVLDLSGRPSSVEFATVLAAGPLIGSGVYVKPGDKVFVKSWAIDIINHEDKKYYFVNADTKGVLAVVHD